MKTAAQFETKARDNAGKGVARKLRREGQVPVILYSKGEDAVKLSMPLKELTLEYKKGAFSNKVFALNIDGKVTNALPRDVQRHPVTEVIEHADFQKVTDSSTIHVYVPVKFLNVEKSAGIKRGGVLNIVRHDLELICNPTNIPTVIEIDIAEMNIGDSIHIETVKLPEGTSPAIKRNFTIATIAGRTAEEEEKPAPGAAAAAAAPAAGAKAAPAAAAKPAAKK